MSSPPADVVRELPAALEDLPEEQLQHCLLLRHILRLSDTCALCQASIMNAWAKASDHKALHAHLDEILTFLDQLDVGPASDPHFAPPSFTILAAMSGDIVADPEAWLALRLSWRDRLSGTLEWRAKLHLALLGGYDTTDLRAAASADARRKKPAPKGQRRQQQQQQQQAWHLQAWLGSFGEAMLALRAWPAHGMRCECPLAAEAHGAQLRPAPEFAEAVVACAVPRLGADIRRALRRLPMLPAPAHLRGYEAADLAALNASPAFWQFFQHLEVPDVKQALQELVDAEEAEGEGQEEEADEGQDEDDRVKVVVLDVPEA